VVVLAVLEELGKKFFFTRPADFYLVDAHAKIVLVAAVGRVGDAALGETHRLHIIETSAGCRATSDGMAPIINPSARDRCQRHRPLLSPSTPRPPAAEGDWSQSPASSLPDRGEGRAGLPVSSRRPAARRCR